MSAATPVSTDEITTEADYLLTAEAYSRPPCVLRVNRERGKG